MELHRGLMTIYFKNRGVRVQQLPRKLENQNTPNSGFFFNGVPKYVSSWVICCNLYLIYVLHHNGITQRPHGYMYQKSVSHGVTCAAKPGKAKTRQIRVFLQWYTIIISYL